MDQKRWRQIEDLFVKALEVSPDERDRFLDEACEADASLRREIGSLLACDAPDVPLLSVNDAEPELSDRRIGPYRLVRLLGQGGMGSVHLAVRDDDQFRKDVAIKLLKRGMDTDAMLMRFRQERQILANLEHPFIARLLDGGATDDGLPYFVLEYVDGMPITQYNVEKGLTLPERLRVFRLVCEAVQYAHQNLVVHRDLKPGNILITREGIPKLLDFGIAKLVDPEHRPDPYTLTNRGLRLMTPAYASPEQVLGLPISTSSDIYSLGAVLYELLTAQRAHRFASDTPSEIDRVICEVEPQKPSLAASNRKLAGDLDNIVLTAMRKDPHRRYFSVAEFSEDIRRYMEGLPVRAREDSWTYRSGKFIRRNRLSVAAALLVMASLVGGTVVALGQARRAERRFQLVRGLANSMLFELHDQMSRLPGTTELRAATLQTVVTYLDRLAEDASSDPTLDLEVARAYERVGSVEGHPYRSNVGKTAAALTHYRKALAIYQRLTRQPGVRAQAISGVISANMLASDVEVILGDAAAAQTHLEQAATTAQGNAGIPPDILFTLYTHLADREFQRGAFSLQLDYYRKAMEVAKHWADTEQTPKAAVALRYAYHRLGTSQASTGDLGGARDSFQRCLEIAEELLKRPDATFEERTNVQGIHQSFGDLLAAPDDPNLGDLPGALTHYRASIALSEQFVRLDPNDRNARRTLASAYRSIGLVLLDENPSESLDLYRKALAITEELSQTDNANLEYRYLRARAVLGVGAALHKLGRNRESAPYLASALEISKSIAAAAPGRIWWHRVLSRSYIVSGQAALARGDMAEALKTYQEGLAGAEELFKRVPASLHHELDIADLDEGIARCYLAAADRPGLTPSRRSELRDQASSWFTRSVAIWQHWARRKTAVAYAARRELQLASATQASADLR